MTTAERTFELAFEHHRAGRTSAAQALYGDVLAAEPRHDRAMYLLSVLALESGRHQDAADWLARAITVSPENPAYLSNLGEAYRRLGRWRDAAQTLVKAVALAPELAIPSHNLGLALKELGEADSAIACFERAADLEPEKGIFQYRLAKLLEDRGQAVRALGHYQCALALMPGSPDIARDLARTLRRCGRLRAADALERRATSGGLRSVEVESAFDETRLGSDDDAAREFTAALERDPDFAEAHFNLGIIETRRGESERALACFERATDLAPERFAFQHALARALDDRGDVLRALGHYHAALVLEPASVEVLANLSAALRKLGRASVAAVMSRRAVALPGDTSRAQRELGRSLGELNRWDEAMAACRRAVELAPGDAAAALDLAHVLLEAGLIGEAIEQFRRAVALDPHDHRSHDALVFAMMFDSGCDGRAILEEARRYAARHADPLRVRARRHDNDPNPERRLRVGYVAPTFWDHVMSIFTLPIVEHHDGSAFEVFCYSSVVRPDDVTREFQAHAHAWRDVSRLDDLALAELVRSDGIDVLVDLNMHMGDSRLRTFACRPAPVQVTYAFPSTTGLDSLYRIKDPTSNGESPEADALYSERPLAVPDSYWCYAPRSQEPPVNPLPALSLGSIRFGCLNALWKINDEVVRLWARVLLEVPASRLSLLAPGARTDLGGRVPLTESQRRVLAVFGEMGVDAERVEFLPRASRARYLEYYHHIDIGLDNLPYNGHTTTLDALFMGVPVVTLAGQTAVGCAGLCFAKNLELLELVARSADQYVAAAARLARDLPRLAALRAGLRERLERSPLMDAPRFVRNLESAYRNAWRAWCAGGGEKPA